jgi:hypothetical protein
MRERDVSTRALARLGPLRTPLAFLGCALALVSAGSR